MALLISELETRLGDGIWKEVLCFVCMVPRTEPQILSVLGRSSFHGPTLLALVSVIHPFLSFEFGLGK